LLSAKNFYYYITKSAVCIGQVSFVRYFNFR